MLLGQGRNEMVLCRHGKEGDACPLAVKELPGASRHDVAIDIDRIDGVGDAHAALGGEDVPDVAAVALGSVTDEDLVELKLHAPGGVVVVEDGLTQEIVTLLGAIATEGVAVGHLINGLVHGLDAGLGEGLRHITYAQTDDVLPRAFGFEGLDLLGNVGKEIAALQL